MLVVNLNKTVLKAAKSCKSNFYDYENCTTLFVVYLTNLKTLSLCVILFKTIFNIVKWSPPKNYSGSPGPGTSTKNENGRLEVYN